jgi:hypothetical protein
LPGARLSSQQTSEAVTLKAYGIAIALGDNVA